MKILEITVGNKKYKISCTPGEEGHILALSKKLDIRYNKLAKNLENKASDNLILVILGLMMEDEISNIQKPQNQSKSVSSEKIEKLSKKIDNTISNLESLKLL